jgi:8-oxo-dGTP diphosphatase
LTNVPKSEAPRYLLAAGGLVEKAYPSGPRIAVVHRKRYRDRDGVAGDWVLPKGKQRAGESLRDTALREVAEETGCRAEIIGPGLSTEYTANGVPKLAMFFRMRPLSGEAAVDASEVRDVFWLTPEEAFTRLTYETEREVVRRAYHAELNSAL